jgi:Sporulation protein YtfJ (Spore_YtfJ)
MGRLMGAEADALQKGMSPQLAELAEAIGRQANATAVFGSAIVDGERTVIPVAQARFGLGVGDGLIAKGLGGGMTAKPLGFIVIDRNGVRFQRTPQPSHRACARHAIDATAQSENLAREAARLISSAPVSPRRGAWGLPFPVWS